MKAVLAVAGVLALPLWIGALVLTALLLAFATAPVRSGTL